MRKDLSSRLPIRRGLGADDAATYIGISSGFFRILVQDGRMPRPKLMNGRRVWDIDELDSAFKNLPREGGEIEDVDTWADVAHLS
jgi:hypothetical protein